MNRALAAVLCLALLGAPGAGAIGSGTSAGAAACLWTRHSKRVIKQVRRHGRVRRVVRVVHRWSCDEAPAAGLPATPLSPPPLPVAPAPEPEALGHLTTVQAADNYYTLTHSKVAAGKVTIELSNGGEDPHNLNLKRIDGEGPELSIPDTGPSERNVASLDLPAGTYRLWCSLLEHDKEGMNAQLVVLGG